MKINGLLIDLDGVVYTAGRPIEGSVELIKDLQTRNVPFLFVTNTSSRPRRLLVERLAQLGIQVSTEQILTPLVAAAAWIKQQSRAPVALFAPAGTEEDFGIVEVKNDPVPGEVNSVVVGDLAEKWDFKSLNQVFRLLMAKPEPTLIGLGMTRYWQTESGLQLDVGPVIKAMEYAADKEALVLGKPSRDFFDAAIDILGIDRENTIMIGDDIRGDVAGAQEAGLKAALVRTGKFHADDLEGGISPDLVIENLSGISDYLNE